MEVMTGRRPRPYEHSPLMALSLIYTENACAILGKVDIAAHLHARIPQLLSATFLPVVDLSKSKGEASKNESKDDKIKVNENQ